MPFKKGHIPFATSLESRLKISAGLKRAWTTSPLLLAKREKARERRELEQRAREAREAKILLRKATQAYIAAWKKEHAAELKLERGRKISEALKGRTPWNKGVKAWNNGLTWPDEVKERISNGMVVFWMNRKKASQIS